jgi:hypothetical protein
MKRIYEAANNVEAHMILHMLEDAGLQAHIQGEHLQSGMGELPLGGLVGVAVADEDAQAAIRLIREWEARNPTPVDAQETQAANRNFYGPLIALLVGGAIGGGIVWSLHNGPDSSDGMDWNDDGTIDYRAYYDGRTLDRAERDRNFDGKTDSIEHYGLDGWIRRVESDDDFDGRFESEFSYDDGQVAEWRVDYSGDGTPDQRMTFQYGVTHTYEYLNSSGDVVKRIRYRGSKTDSVQLDLDADGKWERSYRFDRYDEPTDIKTTQ